MIEATIDDLYHCREVGQVELVNGRLVILGLHVWGVGRVCTLLAGSLAIYERDAGQGYVAGSTIAYIVDLPHRKSFSPDVSYNFVIPDDPEGFIPGAPAFAVEVRGPEDMGERADRVFAAKRDDYFAAGTQAVWDVNRHDRTIALYTPDAEEPLVFQSGDTAHAEPALPGWHVAVDDLFR